MPTSGFAIDHWRDLTARSPRPRNASYPATVQQTDGTLEIFRGVFYRGRGAYFVGRIVAGAKAIPLAFCLRHPDRSGLTLDAVLIGEGDLCHSVFLHARLFPRRGAVALRLGAMVARVDAAQARGRSLQRDRFQPACQDGVLPRFRRASATPRPIVSSRPKARRGMVMLVFTLPSYDVVFKLISDRFDAPKDTTPSDVMRRYRMVFEHDRAGRLVEAHEFEHLRIARDRFEPSLLEDLLRDGRTDGATGRRRCRDRARLRRAPHPSAESFLRRSRCDAALQPPLAITASRSRIWPRRIFSRAIF